MAAPSGRVYTAYDRAYNRTPRVRKKHAERLRARRLAIKLYGKSRVQGMDVDHVKSLEAGGANTASNLRLRDVHSNRGDKTYYN